MLFYNAIINNILKDKWSGKERIMNKKVLVGIVGIVSILGIVGIVINKLKGDSKEVD